jgi:hypothetical protein
MTASRRGRLHGVARAASLGLAVLGTALVSTAGAQDAKARAQRLFQEGVEAIDKGDSATGCAKLRESLSLFAVANTLFNVAQCEEDEGKLSAALEHLQRGLSLIDAKDKRAAVAKGRITALDAKVPRLRVVVPVGQAPTTVVVDGREFQANALDLPLRVDIGKHALIIRVAGRQDRKHEVALAAGERTEVVATQGPPAEATPPPASASASSSASAPPLPPTASASSSATPPPPPPPGSGLRTAGFVSLGVGAAALIAAGVTGGMVLSRRATANTICGADKICPQTFQSQLDSDKALVAGNAVAWGVGLAGAGLGGVLLLLSPRSSKGSAVNAAPIVVSRGAGIHVAGEF